MEEKEDKKKINVEDKDKSVAAFGVDEEDEDFFKMFVSELDKERKRNNE